MKKSKFYHSEKTKICRICLEFSIRIWIICFWGIIVSQLIFKVSPFLYFWDFSCGPHHCPKWAAGSPLLLHHIPQPTPPTLVVAADLLSGPHYHHLAFPNSPHGRLGVLTTGLTWNPVGPTWIGLTILSHFQFQNKVLRAYLWLICLLSGPPLLFPA